jgi:hypothetical protein
MKQVNILVLLLVAARVSAEVPPFFLKTSPSF